MSLPITAVGPLKVETNPILMESAAMAGFASASAVAPASQNAVLIFRSLLIYPVASDRSVQGAVAPPHPPDSVVDVFCARNLKVAASTNRRLPLRTFGSCPSDLHHNSHTAGMARIIVRI